MAAEENDESLIPEIQDLLDDFRKTYDDIRIKHCYPENTIKIMRS